MSNNIHSKIQSSINKVESGKLNLILSKLNNNLGIFVNACIDGDMVVPMKEGYSQVEINQKISIVRNESSKNQDDVIKVGWVTNNSVFCFTHTCGGHCIHCFHPGDPGYPSTKELSCAREIYPEEIGGTIEKEYGKLLDELSDDKMGICIVHGHTLQKPFTELPYGIVSIIKDGITTFRSRSEVLEEKGFVPNAWRLESGVCQPVGGFII